METNDNPPQKKTKNKKTIIDNMYLHVLLSKSLKKWIYVRQYNHITPFLKGNAPRSLFWNDVILVHKPRHISQEIYESDNCSE
jgi:hypothetical protein